MDIAVADARADRGLPSRAGVDQVNAGIADPAVVADDPAPSLDAGAQPVGGPQIDEHARLGGPVHLVEALQLAVVAAGVAEAEHRPDLDVLVPQEVQRAAVVRRGETIEAVGPAQGELGAGRQDVVAGALIWRLRGHPRAKGHDPAVRQAHARGEAHGCGRTCRQCPQSHHAAALFQTCLGPKLS